MPRRSPVRRSPWIVAAIMTVAATAGAVAVTAHEGRASAGATVTHSQSTIPPGWWRGTITVTERWDLQVNNASPRQVGEATITIDRTSPAEARYAIRYRDDAQYGDCKHWRKTGSWTGSGPIDVQVAGGKSGFEFLIWPTQARGRPLLPFTVNLESLNCDGSVKGTSQLSDSIKALHFTSKDGASAKVRKGTQLVKAPSAEASTAPAGKVGLYFNRRPQSGQGTTEIAWNLQHVPARSSSPGSSAPIRLDAPFFRHTQYETTAFFPLLRRGELVSRLDRLPRCSGRFVGGPSIDEVGPDRFFTGSDYVATIPKVTAREVAFIPPLARHRNKPVALVGCRYYYESSYAASRKTLRGSITIAAGGRRATRSFSFKICDWVNARKTCSKRQWY